jgi:hypothetical protein
MMSDTDAKPRRYPRKQLQKGIVLAWQGSGARHVDRAKTLGLGGFYIETSEPAAAGTYIQVLIDTKDGEVRARAVVRTVDAGRGMGIEFVGMNPMARAQLHKLIQQLLA